MHNSLIKYPKAYSKALIKYPKFNQARTLYFQKKRYNIFSIFKIMFSLENKKKGTIQMKHIHKVKSMIL
jgi:hypothetical protein